MHKIVAAVNSMIEHAHLIEKVMPYSAGYHFIYNNRYIWSIGKSEDEYFLVFYPNHKTVQDMVNDSDRYETCVSYNTREIKTQEARESFAELYQVLQIKYYGIDEVLDDIINTAA